MSTNGNPIIYGPIARVALDDIPPRSGGRWWPLFREIRDQLVDTDEAVGLRIPFPQKNEALNAKASLDRLFAELDPYIEISVRVTGSGADMFVRRINVGQNGNGHRRPTDAK